MNLAALPPEFYVAVHADCLEGSLCGGDSDICCVEWNPVGTIVAVGCWDGSIVLWDFHTRSICSLLKSNNCQKPITSIAWMADGSSLICCSFQAKAILVWDYLNNKLLQHLQFDDNVGLVSAHPSSATHCVISGTSIIPFILDLSETNGTQPSFQTIRCLQGEPGVPSSQCGAIYGPTGERIYYGTERGRIVVVNSADLRVAGGIAVGKGPVLRLSFSVKGKYLLVQLKQLLRVFCMETYNPISTLEDPCVGVMSWSDACFSGTYPGTTFDSEFVYAGTSFMTMYVFEAATGVIRSRVGPLQSAATSIRGHPFSSIFLACHPRNRAIYVWNRQFKDKWERYNPWFTDLVTNEDTIPKETEETLDIVEPNLESSDDDEGEIDICNLDPLFLPYIKHLNHPGWSVGDIETQPPVVNDNGPTTPNRRKPAQTSQRGRKRTNQTKLSTSSNSDSSGDEFRVPGEISTPAHT